MKKLNVIKNMEEDLMSKRSLTVAPMMNLVYLRFVGCAILLYFVNVFHHFVTDILFRHTKVVV